MPTADAVPVIDIRRLETGADARRALDHACREWGFFQVTGHDTPAALIDGLHRQMRAFFALPDTDKHAIERTEHNHWGFFDRELTKNRRDWKQIYDVGPPALEGPLAGSIPQWPAALPDFRPAIETYTAHCQRLAQRLLAAIAVNLDTAPADLLDHFVPRDTSFLRLNFYPECDEPEDNPGIHPHTDAGALTVLLQDRQRGLEVLRGETWYPVEPVADALVINIGDIVQVWSNDRYRAPLHRVLANREAPRYSAPYFFNPSGDCVYAPLPSVCSTADPARYRPINWGAFRRARAAGDYADHGDEIQISHFRPGSTIPRVYSDAR